MTRGCLRFLVTLWAGEIMLSEQPLKFSIVVPTYNRRDVVVRTVRAIADAVRPWSCELIVVIDGSRDGTQEALFDLPMSMPFQVITQENSGASAARNRGATKASGEYLLFLDDDMISDPGILVAHARVLDQGDVDAVLGHIPVHPESPQSLLRPRLTRWAENRCRRIVDNDGQLTMGDLLTGQLSVRTAIFGSLGGFNEGFTAGGGFGGEDTDFLHRLLESGGNIRFAPDAVSHQLYIVKPSHNVRQARQAGAADATLSRQYPGMGDQLGRAHFRDTPRGWITRAAARGAGHLPSGVVDTAAQAVLRRADAGHADLLTQAAFGVVRDGAYWTGTYQNGGLRPSPRPGLWILAYHAIEELEGAGVGDYAVAPAQFEEQLEALLSVGYSFVDVDTLLKVLAGRPVSKPSLLLTFDDGYADLADHAAPILRRLEIPAVVFAVTSEVGGSNSWDADAGGTRLPLLDAAALRALSRDGWEIGVHSRRHPHLVRLDKAALRDELEGSRNDLTALGISAPRLFAYPYGEHDQRTRAAVRRAGYAAAFALGGVRSTPRAATQFAMPRIEVGRTHTTQALLDQVLDPARVGLRRAAEREARGAAWAAVRSAGLSGAVERRIS